MTAWTFAGSQNRRTKRNRLHDRVIWARTKDFCASFLAAFRVSEGRNLVEKDGRESPIRLTRERRKERDVEEEIELRSAMVDRRRIEN